MGLTSPSSLLPPLPRGALSLNVSQGAVLRGKRAWRWPCLAWPGSPRRWTLSTCLPGMLSQLCLLALETALQEDGLAATTVSQATERSSHLREEGHLWWPADCLLLILDRSPVQTTISNLTFRDGIESTDTLFICANSWYLYVTSPGSNL